MKFARINMDYLDALGKIDRRVRHSWMAEDGERASNLGVVLSIGGTDIRYFVPLICLKPKHGRLKSSTIFHRITDEEGVLVAALQLSDMVPVVPKFYMAVDIPKEKNRFLLQREYEYCAKSEAIVVKKATKLYARKSGGKLLPWEESFVCDFKALEREMLKWLAGIQ